LKSKILNISLLLLAVFILSSCVTKRIGENNEIPPNVQTYYFSKKIVWRNLVQIIRNELLIPFQYASYKRGHFVCRELTSADQPGQKMKVQLSGFLTFDGSGTVLTLYRQIVAWDLRTETWKAYPTDYILETTILRRLEEKLARYRKK